MIKDKISKDIQAAMESLELKVNPDFNIEIPSHVDFGDYSSNVAMVSTKLNKMKPREMAEKIAEVLKKKRYYGSVDVAGPGFINFKLSNTVFQNELVNIVENPETYGKVDHGNGTKILIEFISANPTGPLNVVSARAAAYGDTLYRVMKYTGYQPVREYYNNDAGNQVDILAESVELRYRELHNENIGEFPVEAYHGEYIKEIAAHLNAIEGTKLLHVSERDRLQKMKEFALQEIHEMQINSLERFGVEFDSWVSEKNLRAQGVVEEVLSFLAEANCTYEMDEAVWFASSKFGDEKDRVLMKSDGSITYIVPDVAYHLTKYQRGFDVMIDVLGPDHHGYVPRLKAAINALEYDESKLEVVFLQQVNLFLEGERVKMSKREGRIITMDDLIDEVGKDAARFFFINRRPSAHLNFDMELAKKQSSENPVYYCQYAHARICSIIKKAKKEKVTLKNFDPKSLRRLDKQDEILMIKKMLEFSNILISISETREPHRLADFVMELAGMFHKYYQKYTIVNAKSLELSQARLYLITAVRTVLFLGLDLMGISAPEKM